MGYSPRRFVNLSIPLCFMIPFGQYPLLFEELPSHHVIPAWHTHGGQETPRVVWTLFPLFLSLGSVTPFPTNTFAPFWPRFPYLHKHFLFQYYAYKAYFSQATRTVQVFLFRPQFPFPFPMLLPVDASSLQASFPWLRAHSHSLFSLSGSPLSSRHQATLESLWVNLGAAARGTALRVQPFIYTFTLGTDLGSVW